MKMLIGLGGKKQSGKDETAGAIRSAFHLEPVHRVAFADELKAEVAEACGVTVRFINEHKNNFRLILQGWGTDFRRDLCEKTYWINKTRERLELLPEDAIVVVTDVRFPNEAQLIKDLGGSLWKVERPALAAAQAGDPHASETALDDWPWDEVIVNGDSIAALHKKVREILQGVPA